jgi:hypothetical protein
MRPKKLKKKVKKTALDNEDVTQIRRKKKVVSRS